MTTVPAKEKVERDLAEHMRQYLAGRIEGFDAVYDALAGRLHTYLRSLCRDSTLAEDLLQETFLQMHRSRRTYQPGRPVTPWAFAIARHVFLMHRRATARRARLADELAFIGESAARPERSVADTVIDRDRLRRVLGRVPAGEREAVVLHHAQGWSFTEIAARLGIRASAARTRAFRGLTRMRDGLDK